MGQRITIQAVYEIVTGGPGEDGDRGTTTRSIARRLGRDETDPEVHALVKSMAVSGYIRKGPLGAYNAGPTPMPSQDSPWARPEHTPCPQHGRSRFDAAGRCLPACGWGWDSDPLLIVRDQYNREAGRPAPAGVVPGCKDDPDSRQRAADRALLDRLAASEAAGNLTTHGLEDACSLGLWHEGPCPDENLERQLVLDDQAEDRGGDRDDMDTCGVHRMWARDCVTNPDHSNVVLGYNWCRLHENAVQRCGCWTANLSGRPLPGDEPQHLSEEWIDWMLDPRVHSDGTRGGLSFDSRRGIVRVVPHPDGQWRIEGPYTEIRMAPTRHQAMLLAVDGEVWPDAVHRPAGRRAPSGVVPGGDRR